MRTLFIALLGLLPLNAAAEEFSEDELLEAIEVYTPNRYDRLIALKETDPEAYAVSLETISAKLSNRTTSSHTEPLEEVEARFRELITQHAESSKHSQEAIRRELEAVAIEYFELKMEVKRQRLQAIQAKVDRLEAELESNEARRDQIIAKRIDKAIAEASK